MLGRGRRGPPGESSGSNGLMGQGCIPELMHGISEVIGSYPDIIQPRGVRGAVIVFLARKSHEHTVLVDWQIHCGIPGSAEGHGKGPLS